jgi:hypothetical protein
MMTRKKIISLKVKRKKQLLLTFSRWCVEPKVVAQVLCDVPSVCVLYVVYSQNRYLCKHYTRVYSVYGEYWIKPVRCTYLSASNAGTSTQDGGKQWNMEKQKKTMELYKLRSLL